MAHTIFYNGKLKRTRTPSEVFAKIKTFVKPKGVTKSWSIEENENCLVIDFGCVHAFFASASPQVIS